MSISSTSGTVNCNFNSYGHGDPVRVVIARETFPRLVEALTDSRDDGGFPDYSSIKANPIKYLTLLTAREDGNRLEKISRICAEIKYQVTAKSNSNNTKAYAEMAVDVEETLKAIDRRIQMLQFIRFSKNNEKKSYPETD